MHCEARIMQPSLLSVSTSKIDKSLIPRCLGNCLWPDLFINKAQITCTELVKMMPPTLKSSTRGEDCSEILQLLSTPDAFLHEMP